MVNNNHNIMAIIRREKREQTGGLCLGFAKMKKNIREERGEL